MGEYLFFSTPLSNTVQYLTLICANLMEEKQHFINSLFCNFIIMSTFRFILYLTLYLSQNFLFLFFALFLPGCWYFSYWLVVVFCKLNEFFLLCCKYLLLFVLWFFFNFNGTCPFNTFNLHVGKFNFFPI